MGLALFKKGIVITLKFAVLVSILNLNVLGLHSHLKRRGGGG